MVTADHVSLTEIITRLRRQTRNPDIITLCDELEWRLHTPAVLPRAGRQAGEEGFDRLAYQREYMRRKRERMKNRQ